MSSVGFDWSNQAKKHIHGFFHVVEGISGNSPVTSNQ